MKPIEALQERICNSELSELGHKWINNPLMKQDIWSVEKLGYTEEESKIKGVRKIYFDDFSLPWLKLLSKLTILSTSREKCSLNVVRVRTNSLRQLDKFLVSKGYSRPEIITDALLQEFISSRGNCGYLRPTIAYATRLWKEEGWLKLPYIPRKYKRKTPEINIIPEEVLYQIYENFHLFPPQLERLFRLQLVLGCRIGELLKIPRCCLKQESDQWFLLRWIQKRKRWEFYQISFAVAELIQEQQNFLDEQFGLDSNFEKLFCRLSVSISDGAAPGGRYKAEPIYFPELITLGTIRNWLCDFSEKTDLKDKHGNRFHLTSHMFRRTKASLMAYCEAEDEYIAAVLGHGCLDMLPHYRKRSLDRLEKEANIKGYVDMYGQITDFKPRKRRYERLAEILKVNTPLGECHRPSMLGDCQYRYACLSCNYHRVTLEDKPKLEMDIQRLQGDLKKTQIAGQERRVTEINRLLGLLTDRLQGLEELEYLKEEKDNGSASQK